MATDQYITQTQEAVDKAADVLATINKIKSEIDGIDNTISKLEDKNKKAEDEISRLPEGKTKYKSEITRLQNIDRPLIDLYYNRDKLSLELKKLTGIIDNNEYIVSLQSLDNLHTNNILDNENSQTYYTQLLNTVDPETEQKKTDKKQKTKSQKLKNKSASDQKKAQLKRLKSLAKNGALLMVPILVELLTQQLIKTITQIDSLNNKIDILNDEIDQVNIAPTPQSIQVVVNKKNALLNEIDSIKQSIERIKTQIDTLNTFLLIFNIIVSVATLALSVIPTPAPPGVIIVPTKIISKVTLIINAIQAVLAIMSSELDKAISDLEEIKSRIKDIEDRIEGKTSNNILKTGGDGGTNGVNNISTGNGQLSNTLGNIAPLGTLPDSSDYKGFKFAIREEDTPGAPTVGGYKRHYAAAIDTNGVEVLKTDLSFTTDTQVLIDQLKYIIDTQNLKA